MNVAGASYITIPPDVRSAIFAPSSSLKINRAVAGDPIRTTRLAASSRLEFNAIRYPIMALLWTEGIIFRKRWSGTSFRFCSGYICHKRDFVNADDTYIQQYSLFVNNGLRCSHDGLILPLYRTHNPLHYYAVPGLFRCKLL